MADGLHHQADGSGTVNPQAATEPVDPVPPTIPHVALPPDYHFDAVDSKYIGKDKEHKSPKQKKEKEADLGVLAQFPGVWKGIGFNQIFRPNSGATPTQLPIPVSPPPPAFPNDSILELNLTRETLTFSKPLGEIPNRGFGGQGDIFLNGVTYVQSIDDVANPDTGKFDGDRVNIHIENGMWMHVPATDVDPELPASVSRMGTIPHGTSINAQGIQIPKPFPGGPRLDPAPITPFFIGSPDRPQVFPAQTATDNATARLPQDLSKFIAAGTITQAILDDVNTVLREAIKGQNILETTVINISTSTGEDIPVSDDGTSNIAFLTGTKATATDNTPSPPNANALHMEAIFWIETVEYEIEVPVWKPGQGRLLIRPKRPSQFTPVPVFEVKPPHEITQPIKIKAKTKQLQYSQLVNLDFGPLTWPHRSVATLVPKDPVHVNSSVFTKKP
ncbi:hypothetical protein LIA77_01991 [Sarocladium implicatum]|nr:hypothetical protein LIA77_01991 [Sarocladium implicatum]